MNRNVTPDSWQSIAFAGGRRHPSLSTIHFPVWRTSLALSAEIEFAVAWVSSHESGFTMVVVPFDNSPATNARWVSAFDGGAVSSPEIRRVGTMVTFN